MKYMKLGSKPDAFQSDGKTRYVSSELTTDFIINVGEVKFYLHKFPLLSKSNRLQKLVTKADGDNSEEIHLFDFPGGSKAFEICVKFCYGIVVTLNAYNVVAARCASEYLEMTEDVDRGNLIFKIEVFLNSSIFRSWKDSIIVLQMTKSLLPWSEGLKIVGRCIDSIASKTSVDPANVTWSYTHNRKLSEPDEIVEDDDSKIHERFESVPKDWWVEDICELEIDHYKRLMISIKSKGRMDGIVIGEALKTYAIRWLPNSVDALVSEAHAERNKSLVETIICLLPSDKETTCSCSFLLKLLNVAILVGADESSREDLLKRASLKLNEASVNDLLIPAQPPKVTRFDIELVHYMVNRYLMHVKTNQGSDPFDKNGKGIDNYLLRNKSLLNVGKLVDGYLAEIAYDPNLTLSCFIDLSQSIPESARPIHDGLYRSIDIYLKEHLNLAKAERKKVCGLIDVRKLTVEASMDAAQNDRLPLRVIVQVLFFEQIRASARPPTDEECKKTTTLQQCKNLKEQMSQVKVSEEYVEDGKLGNKKKGKNSRSVAQLLPSRSRRIFDKLWGVGGGGKGSGENKSSETSTSSQSPTSNVPGDNKSSASSSRHRRHSVS